jgi:AcrR family transcriptional regulator
VQIELRRLAETRDVPIRGRRAQVKEQNRRVILDAARHVFSELGYGATTVRDIIRATPLASGTFYNYFKSKEEVLQAIHDEAALAVRPALRDARLKAETAEAFVAATFRAFFAYVAANRVSFIAVKQTDSVHRRVDTPEVLAGFAELHEDIVQAMGRGLFPDSDAEFLTAAIIGVAFEMTEALQRRPTADADAAANFATTLFMGGITSLPRHTAGAN